MNPNPAIAALWSPPAADLLTHLWQSTAVAVAVLLLLAAGRRLSPSTRRALGWMALAKFLFPAAWVGQVIESFHPFGAEWLASDTLQLPIAAPAVFPATAAAAQVPAAALADPVTIGLAVWATGFVLLFACWLGRGIRVRRRLVAEAAPVGAALEAVIASAAARAGLTHAPRALLVDHAAGPAVSGITHPLLLLPRGLSDALSTREMEAVLLHELVHIQRRDTLWATLQAFVVSALWFNPVVWLLHRGMCADAEKACDDRVLALTGEPEIYAGVLVKSARHALGLPSPAFAGIGSPPVIVRMRNILSFHFRREPPMARAAALAAGGFLVVLGGHAGTIAAVTADALPPVELAAQPAVTAAQPAEIAAPPPAVAAPHEAATTPGLPAAQASSVEIAPVSAPATAEPSIPEAPAQVSAPFPETAPATQPFPAGARAPALVETAAAPEAAPAEAAAAAPPSATPAPFGAVAAALPAPPATILPANIERTQEAVAAPEAPAASGMALELPAHPVLPNAAVRKRTAAAEGRITAGEANTRAAEPARRKSGASIKPASLDMIPQERTWFPWLKRRPTTPRYLVHAETPKVYDIQDVETKPLAVLREAPGYPMLMRRASLGGEVLMQFIVTPDGNVAAVEAVESTRPEFEASALSAVTGWRFKPGTVKGRPVYTRIRMPIVFKLDET